MRYKLLFGLVLTLLLWLMNWQVVWADPPLQIVTTTTDLKSLVEVVGGERVLVASVLPPSQDPHNYEPRLSDLQAVQKAQLIVRIGLDHDIWLDPLLRQANNSDLQKNGNGYVDASLGIPLLEAKSLSLTSVNGHNHGAGNPHYWLDPLNAEAITGSIEEGLIRIDPIHAEDYALNRDRFLQELRDKVKVWSDRLAPYRGNPIVVYHNSWPYLTRRFRLKTVGYIEPKSGVPPSPTHLANLVRAIKEQKVPVVIKESYESDNIPRYLNRNTGAKTLTLAASVGAVPEARDYFSMFDYNVEQLVKGFSKS